MTTKDLLPVKSLNELYAKSYKTLAFEGDWLDLIGTPEVAGTWLIWGLSGNGKSRFTLRLVKYLCGFERVLYNSLEEGDKLTFKRACKAEGMEAVKGKFQYTRDSYEALKLRLSKGRSVNIIVIDSLQHFRISKKEYYDLVQRYPKKLFIFISHAKGAEPKGDLADEVKYNSDVKLRVDKFVCTPVETTRYGGHKPYIIWEEGYRKSELKLT